MTLALVTTVFPDPGRVPSAKCLCSDTHGKEGRGREQVRRRGRGEKGCPGAETLAYGRVIIVQIHHPSRLSIS